MILSRGVINTFGIYQTYYQSNFLSSLSESDISWIGSVQAFLLFSVGGATGPLYDLGYLRQLLVVCSILINVGMMMTSICTNYWQTILAQGIMVSVGDDCLFVSSIVIVGQYFTTRKAFATGMASLGSSLRQ